MNLEELSMQLEQAVDNLFVVWLTYDEGCVKHSVMSNALKATCAHINNIAKAITGIVENCPAEIICKCEVEK